MGILVLVLIPFVGFYVPETPQLILSLSAGAVFILSLFWLYKALQLFETSRVVPSIGGLTPLFTFGLIYIFTWGGEVLPSYGFIAFILLVLGTILINFEKEKLINLKSFRFAAATAFLLSLAFVLTKYIYLAQPFWNGFIWRSIGGFLMAICFFIFFPEIKKEILVKGEKFPKKNGCHFFFLIRQPELYLPFCKTGQFFLAPLTFVPIVNALNGIQYVFLFIFSTFFLLLFFFSFLSVRPRQLKKISGE